jgi:hypothetical protein
MFTNSRCFSLWLDHLHSLPLPLSTPTSTSDRCCTSLPLPNPPFLFDIFWLFAVMRNQVIFRKLEEQETRALQGSQVFLSTHHCILYHRSSSCVCLFLFFLFPSTIPYCKENGPFEKLSTPTSNPKLVQSYLSYINGDFTLDDDSSILQHTGSEASSVFPPHLPQFDQRPLMRRLTPESL